MTATDDASDSQERTRTAWLANVRQEFLAPVRGIIEICEMVLQDAGDRGREDFLADLRKVREAGQRFLTLVHEVIDPAQIEADQAAFTSRVRHDLRTPLNHVIGYCDIWLE